MGLVKGGSLDAAAIIHDGAIICKEALRYPNEIVRHKILDIVGDIYLTGCPDHRNDHCGQAGPSEECRTCRDAAERDHGCKQCLTNKGTRER